MADSSRLLTLGVALRAHRSTLLPEDFGLPVTARRRTPGLRREEVAALSGVGTTWYAWLEQGRVSASAQVLGAISRALRLDEHAYRHLMGLAGHLASCSGEPAGQVVDALRPLLDSWPASPALALDRRFDVLAWNSAYVALWGDPGKVAPSHRTLLWLLAGDPSVRERTDGWESLIGALAAQFRGRADRYPDDPRFDAVYEVLRTALPELAPWWSRSGVCEFTSQTIVVDGIQLAVYMLRPIDDPDAVVLLQAPVDDVDRIAITKLIDAAT
jgi:transcriptional regulator with XRE-family HTH domain